MNKDRLFGNYEFERDWDCYVMLYSHIPDMMTGLYELWKLNEAGKEIVIDIMNERAERYRDIYYRDRMLAYKFRFTWIPSEEKLEVYDGDTRVLTLPYGSNYLVNDTSDMSTPVYLDGYEIHEIAIDSVSLSDKDNPHVTFTGKLFRTKGDKWLSRNDLRLAIERSKVRGEQDEQD
jgi:hypothetical protein